ncbi:glycosyltransferase [Flavobacterium flavipallidum]|uniref:Glycosyltransferase n=1 Tax=Flavobacterium flavipallidum TaxID=3139140 RepID=A0ABU9HJZ6_9FLAO
MLSIIISSYQKSYFNQFEKNVEATIGTGFQYEIIKIDNPGIMGICAAYNSGAAKAKYPNLLFIHEDVQFETQNWGDILIQYLKRPEIGIVGLAGATRKTKMISSWYQLLIGDKDANRYNYKQVFKFQDRATEVRTNNPLQEYTSDVITLDGLFLAIEASKFNHFKFDESLLKSFHGYDLDFSLNVSTQYQNIVIYDILLTHFSEGKVNECWEKEALLVHKKWMKTLPIDDGVLTNSEIKNLETAVLYDTLNRIFSYDLDKFSKLLLIWRILKTYKMKSKFFQKTFLVELRYKLFN